MPSSPSSSDSSSDSSSASSSPSSSPQLRRNPTNGILRNRNWYCNCEPPRPAIILQVKKETENKGKKFYACPIKLGEGNRCNLFLWMDEAQQRRQESFKSNGRTEKRQTTIPESITPRKVKREPEERTPAIEIVDQETVGSRASTSRSATTSTSNPPPPVTVETSTLKGSGKGRFSRIGNISETTSSSDEDEGGTSNRTSRSTNKPPLQPSAMPKTLNIQPTGSKRKRPAEENFDEFSTSGEEEFIAVAERSSKTAGPLGKRRDAFITPSHVRTTDIENGMLTPLSTKGKSVKKVLFKDEIEISRNGAVNAKRQRVDSGEILGTDAINLTASSSALPGALAPPRIDPANWTREVMDLLKEENISFATRHAVRKTLERYADQARGYELGRDISRKAIKEAEDKSREAIEEAGDRCAALKARVDNLEKAREECRTRLMSLWNSV